MRGDLKQIIFLGLFMFLGLTELALAQGGAGSLRGTVTDPSGGVVPSAKVTLTQVGTGSARTVSTDAGGNYMIPQLPPADYILTIDAQGFRTLSQRGITLLADQSVTNNVTLQLGATTQTVKVEAAAAMVDTTTATLNEVVNQTEMVELPLNGRNAAALTLLVAGTVAPNSGGGGSTQGITKEFPSQLAISTSGAQEDQVSYLLDGATFMDTYFSLNMPFPFPDALEEFSVQTSNYAAQYGNNAGGVVNVVTKSGTNSLHGNAFEFDRNAVFNARNFFAAHRDQLKRNQYGGTVGGPVDIPGVYNGKDRTFFFFGFQGTRIRDVGSVSSGYVPTLAEVQNGDFSAYLSATNPNNPLQKAVILTNPSTGQPYPGNIIPTSSFDPLSMALVNQLPQVNGQGLVYYISRTIQNEKEFVYRVDHSISPHDRLTFRGTWNTLFNDGYYDPHDLMSLAGYSDLPAQDYLLHETHIFRPNLLNEFRFSYGRMPVHRGPEAGSPGLASLGMKGIWDQPPQAISSVSVSGGPYISEYPLAIFRRQNYSWADDLSWVKGSHNVQFGVSAERWRMDLISQSSSQPQVSFSPSNGTGLGLANFMIGDMYQFTQGNGTANYWRDTHIGFYAQDSFRVTKRLTLNYGLRWEPAYPWSSARPTTQYFKPSNYYAGVHSTLFPNAPTGLLFGGDPGVPGYLGFEPSYTPIMPRVGFAYDVFGNGKTSLRGGAGLFYDTAQGADLPNEVDVGLAPFNPTLNLIETAGPFSNPYLGTTNPFPAQIPPPSNTTFATPVTVDTEDGSHTNQVVPRTANWNLAIEQQLGPGWLLRVAYVGNHAWHIRDLEQLNPAVYTPGSSASTQARRAMQQGLGGILQTTYDCYSWYNGLQVSLEKRYGRGTFLHGLKLLANYTYARDMDDLPYNAGVEFTGVSVLPLGAAHRHQMDYGRSDFDRGQVASISYEYSLPGLRGSNRYERGALGDWELTGILSMDSGDPLTILSGIDNSKTGLSYDRAVQVGSPKGGNACGAAAPCVNFLNPASFTTNTLGTPGTLGRGTFSGPNLIDWDMGIFKNFSLTERFKLQFRAEFFNIFNRANFLDPGTSVSASGFGGIESANDPRIGQLALKLNF